MTPPARGIVAVALSLAVAVTACSSEAATGGRDATVPSSGTKVAGPRCSPPRRPAAADGTHTFEFDGRQRSYALTLPSAHDGRRMVPMVLDLHGYGGSKEQEEINTAMAVKGAKRGFIVVTPDALGSPRRWNWRRSPGEADDYAFIHALVEDLERAFCVDPERVYVAGHSNGAGFAGFLACSPPFQFAAVAMVSGTTPSTCPSGVTPSVLAIRGTADVTVRYDEAAIDVLIDSYVRSYRCDTDPTRDSPHVGVERVRYQGCDNGAEVLLDIIVGGTHVWPGGPTASGSSPSAAGNSVAGRTFVATDHILDFFELHRRSWD